MKTPAIFDQSVKSVGPLKRPCRAAPSLSHLLGNVIDQLSIINLCCYQLRGALPTGKMIDVVKEVDHLETAVLETNALVEKFALGMQSASYASARQPARKRPSEQIADNVYAFSLNLKRQGKESDAL